MQYAPLRFDRRRQLNGVWMEFTIVWHWNWRKIAPTSCRRFKQELIINWSIWLSHVPAASWAWVSHWGCCHHDLQQMNGRIGKCLKQFKKKTHDLDSTLELLWVQSSTFSHAVAMSQHENRPDPTCWLLISEVDLMWFHKSTVRMHETIFHAGKRFVFFAVSQITQPV